jgi:hypothetical protein
MRTILTAVLLGFGTLYAAVPAEASWLSESFHRGRVSVYVGPSRPAVYVTPSYYPPVVVPAPYVVPTYAAPTYVVPSVRVYDTLPVAPLYRYSGYRTYDHHSHYHHHH